MPTQSKSNPSRRGNNMLVGIAYEELNQANATLKRENEDLRSKIQELSGIIQLAYLDPLTGIHNRRYYEQRILEEINRAQRHPDQVFSLVLIDLNDFKVINDSFGHAKGDEVLRRFSAFLTSNIRAQDICCRFAGDEFVIILPSTVKEEAQQFTDRLRVELRKDNSTSEI